MLPVCLRQRTMKSGLIIFNYFLLSMYQVNIVLHTAVVSDIFSYREVKKCANQVNSLLLILFYWSIMLLYNLWISMLITVFLLLKYKPMISFFSFFSVGWSNHQQTEPLQKHWLHPCLCSNTITWNTESNQTHMSARSTSFIHLVADTAKFWVLFKLFLCSTAVFDTSWGCRQWWVIHFLLLINTELQPLRSLHQRGAVRFHSSHSSHGKTNEEEESNRRGGEELEGGVETVCVC